MVTKLPSGTVTFLFTDIVDSTPLMQRLGDAYQPLLGQHHAVLRAAIAEHGGAEVKSGGDGLFVAFARATDAVAAAVQAQRELTAREWPEGAAFRVRMGMARVQGARGHGQRAARIFGATAFLREATSSPRQDREQAARATSGLSEEELRAAEEEGRALPLDLVVAEALSS